MSLSSKKLFQKELEMEPMTAYDRRISTCFGRLSDIKTESVGEGFDRSGSDKTDNIMLEIKLLPT